LILLLYYIYYIIYSIDMYPKSLEQRICKLKIRTLIFNDIMTFDCFFIAFFIAKLLVLKLLV